MYPSIWENHTERPNVGDVCIGSRKGAPPRRGCMANGQRKQQMTSPPPANTLVPSTTFASKTPSASVLLYILNAWTQCIICALSARVVHANNIVQVQSAETAIFCVNTTTRLSGRRRGMLTAGGNQII